MASFLDARSRSGQWHLRIDDLDAPRVSKSAEMEILRSLESHGLLWDGELIHQQDHHQHYKKALDELADRGHTFPCTCRRKDIDHKMGCVLACDSTDTVPSEPFSIRMRVSLNDITVDDDIQGPMHGSTWGSTRNIAIWRRDGIPSYPLSVIVDDSIMGVSHIVRGSDLAENTVHQAFLLDKLGFQRPQYAHVPVVTDRKGEKLSKRDKATTIDSRHSVQNVMWSMQLLGLDPPQRWSLKDLLKWGIEHWSLHAVPSEARLSNVVSV